MEWVINLLWMIKMNKLFFIFLFLLVGNQSFAYDWKRVQDLRGAWKFSIGDEKEWAQENYNDSSWDRVFVPSSWEDEGFPGYDGYAWYRKTFAFDKNTSGTNLYLRLGYIDDVDQVFVNGILVGSTGSFPPYYYSAYDTERFYRLPDSVVHVNDKNIIAVRVFDRELSGGILRGQCGIYEKKYEIDLDISLEGLWKFRTGDDRDYKRVDYSDNLWKEIFVPDTWERQIGAEYDGYAWYRKRFFIPEELMGNKLILLMGKIDDLDETYLNGNLIGSIGRLYEDASWVKFSDEWLEIRAYEIDKNDIIYGGQNLIAVRVFDGMVNGGIYEGPVGITTREQFLKWKPKKNEKSLNFFEWFFDK